MFLKVNDLATAVGVDEKTVLNWIKNKGCRRTNRMTGIRSIG